MQIKWHKNELNGFASMSRTRLFSQNVYRSCIGSARRLTPVATILLLKKLLNTQRHHSIHKGCSPICNHGNYTCATDLDTSMTMPCGCEPVKQDTTRKFCSQLMAHCVKCLNDVPVQTSVFTSVECRLGHPEAYSFLS